MPIKVIQWTTGHVGREAVKGIMRHPELELVGCYAWSSNGTRQDDLATLAGVFRSREARLRQLTNQNSVFVFLLSPSASNSLLSIRPLPYVFLLALDF